MTYLIAFYWLCAGLASFKVDRGRLAFGYNFPLSMIFGGILVPTRIMAKLAA